MTSVSGTQGQESVARVHDEAFDNRIVIVGEIIEVHAHCTSRLTPQSDAAPVAAKSGDVVADPFDAVDMIVSSDYQSPLKSSMSCEVTTLTLSAGPADRDSGHLVLPRWEIRRC